MAKKRPKVARRDGTTPPKGQKSSLHRHFQVSVHTLMMAFDCPLRMAMKFRGYASIEDNRSLVCGIAAHKALAAYMRGDDWHDAIAYFEQVTAENNMIDDRRGYPNLVAVMSEIFDRFDSQPMPFVVTDPAQIETSFAYPLGTVNVLDETIDVDLIGVLDGCVTDLRTRHPFGLEWKTTGKLDTNYTRSFAWNLQTTAYTWAIQKVTGMEIANFWLGAIEIRNIPRSDRKCPDHGSPYAECGPLHIKNTFLAIRRTPEQLATFERNALKASEAVIKAALWAERYGDEGLLEMPCYGDFTGTCDMCEFCPWSRNPEGRRLDLLGGMFKHVEPTEEVSLRSGFVK